MKKSHKDLKVWQEGMNLVTIVYEVSSAFPPEERFGLFSKMRRAAISIPSNIAEGSARSAKKESIRFYIIARASLSELDTQVELCKLLAFIAEEAYSKIQNKIDIVDSLLSGLIRYHRKTSNSSDTY